MHERILVVLLDIDTVWMRWYLDVWSPSGMAFLIPQSKLLR